jgi:hypothetical protein
MRLGNEVILMIQNPSGGGSHPLDASCANWQGHTLPGGFGLLETVSGNPCTVLEYPFNWVHTNSGSSTSCDLSGYVGKLISIPVFNCDLSSNTAPTSEVLPADPGCSAGNGSNAWYHHQGWATFYLSGYHVTTTGGAPNQVKSLVSNSFPCSGGDSCISGWFVSGELAATSLGGPPGGTNDFGSFAVVPAG